MKADAASIAQADFLYSQQWQISEPAAFHAAQASMQSLGTAPRLSVFTNSGKSHWQTLAGDGGVLALLSLAALQRAATNRGVIKVVALPYK